MITNLMICLRKETTKIIKNRIKNRHEKLFIMINMMSGNSAAIDVNILQKYLAVDSNRNKVFYLQRPYSMILHCIIVLLHVVRWTLNGVINSKLNNDVELFYLPVGTGKLLCLVATYFIKPAKSYG